MLLCCRCCPCAESLKYSAKPNITWNSPVSLYWKPCFNIILSYCSVPDGWSCSLPQHWTYISPIYVFLFFLLPLYCCLQDPSLAFVLFLFFSKETVELFNCLVLGTLWFDNSPAKFLVKTRVTSRMGMMTVPMVTTRSKGSSNLSCTMRLASAPLFSSWEEPGRISSFSFSPASRAVAMSRFWSRMCCIQSASVHAHYDLPLQTRLAVVKCSWRSSLD